MLTVTSCYNDSSSIELMSYEHYCSSRDARVAHEGKGDRSPLLTHRVLNDESGVRVRWWQHSRRRELTQRMEVAIGVLLTSRCRSVT